MKSLLNFRFGKSSWSLSLGEYVFLVVAVVGGWFAGFATSEQSVAARSAPATQLTGGTNATELRPGTYPAPAAE